MLNTSTNATKTLGQSGRLSDSFRTFNLNVWTTSDMVILNIEYEKVTDSSGNFIKYNCNGTVETSSNNVNSPGSSHSFFNCQLFPQGNFVIDTEPPTWTGGGSLTLTNVSDSSITFNWSGHTDNYEIASVGITCDGNGSLSNVIGFGSKSQAENGSMTIYTSNFSSTPCAGSFAGAHTFQVWIRDGADGNWSTSGPTATKDS